MKNIIKKLNILIIFAIVMGGLSGCKVVEDKENKKIEQVQNFTQFLEMYGQEINIEPVDTFGWQTFVGEEYGLSFKYPEDWVVQKIDVPKVLSKKYKDCYDFHNISRFWFLNLFVEGHCADEYGGLGMKDSMRSYEILCINPNKDNLDRGCYISFRYFTPIFENIDSVWDVYEKSYENEDAAKYMKFGKVNEKIFFTNNTSNNVLRFWNGNSDLFDIGHYEKDDESTRVRDGILQTLE